MLIFLFRPMALSPFTDSQPLNHNLKIRPAFPHTPCARTQRHRTDLRHSSRRCTLLTSRLWQLWRDFSVCPGWSPSTPPTRTQWAKKNMRELIFSKSVKDNSYVFPQKRSTEGFFLPTKMCVLQICINITPMVPYPTCSGSTAMRAVRGPFCGITRGSGSMFRANFGLSVMMNTRAPLALT